MSLQSTLDLDLVFLHIENDYIHHIQQNTLQLVDQSSPAHSIIGVYSGYADIPTA